MKLSSREKNLLIGAVVLLLAVGIYFFVVDPIHTANAIALEEYNQIDTQYRMVKTDVKGDEEINSIIDEYRDRMAYLDSKLPPQLYLEKIIDDVFTHFRSYDIVINSVSFNMVESSAEDAPVTENENGELAVENLRPVMSVNDILESYEAGENLTEVVVVDGEEMTLNYESIGYMNVSLSFESNYEVLKSSLKGLEQLDSTILPLNLSISKAPYNEDDSKPDNNKVFVALTLGLPFYYDNEELEDIYFDYEFEPDKDFENHGPFEYEDITNYTESDRSSQASVTALKPDFELAIRSATSDLPAQSITYSEVSSSNVDLDGNRAERYTLNITENNGVISFRYANDIESYPPSGYQRLSSSNDNIVIRVNSSTRINGDDAAGLTLVLDNRSGKKVIFYVFNDDKSNPRFNVIVNSGTYDIIRN